MWTRRTVSGNGGQIDMLGITYGGLDSLLSPLINVELRHMPLTSGIKESKKELT